MKECRSCSKAVKDSEVYLHVFHHKLTGIFYAPVPETDWDRKEYEELEKEMFKDL